MLDLTVQRSAQEILRQCRDRGLEVKLDTFDKARGGRHWHLGYPGRPGVLELTDLGDHASLKVADRRDGGWATALARELARQRPRRGGA
jgi:hypothetical protein